jgi:DNA-binding SARP family transcriptional activator/predicted ATPase
MVEIGVLGPVELRGVDGQATRLGGPKPRAVLAYLALEATRVVSADGLLEAVWGEAAPATAVNTLQVTISSLRRALAPCGITLPREGSGYRLDLPPSSIDVHRFEALVAEGRAVLRSGDAARAEGLLATAISLWRGQPFEDLDDPPFARSVRPALENVLRAASFERIETLIELDRFEEAIVESERLVSRWPLDERAWALTMVGYYWAGRQADALAAYQRARAVLADELGIDPGPSLTELEQAVLAQTVPRLGRPTRTSQRIPEVEPTLPPMRPLVGRDELVEHVVERLRSDVRLVSLVGLGGIGKTSLALAVAHRLLADGAAVWFLDYTAGADAAAAVETVSRTLGLGPADDLGDALRTRSAAREVVLVLDNLETVEDAGALVRTLLDADASLRLLVTSRRALRVRSEHLVSIPPLAVHTPDGTGDAAVELFDTRAREVRSDLGPLDPATAAQVCELTAGIPLAIELAALQLRALTPKQLLDRLRRSRAAVIEAAGTRDHPDRQQSLRAVLDATVDDLSPSSRGLLSRLALVEGPVTVELLELGFAPSEGDVLGAIGDLAEAGLFIRADDGRLRVLAPIAQYVVGRLEDDERLAAARDLLTSVVTLVRTTEGRWYGPDAGEQRRRLEADEAAIHAAFSVGLHSGHVEEVARAALLLGPYWLQQSRLTDALTTLDHLGDTDLPPELTWRIRLLRGTFASYVNRPDTAELLAPALEEPATSTPPDRLVVNAWCCLGAFLASRHATDEVRRCVEAASAAAVASGDPQLVALARDFAGHAASYLGDTETAIRLNLEAIDDARRHGDTHALALLLATVTEPLLETGRIEQAEVLATEAFDLARRVDLGIALTRVQLMVGATHLEAGRAAAAWGSLVENLRFMRERYPDPIVTGDALSHLAAAEAMLGDDETAARMWGASAAMQTDHGIDPDRRRLRTNQRHVDEVRGRLGADRFDALMVAGSADPAAVIDAILDRPDATTPEHGDQAGSRPASTGRPTS